MSKAGSSRSSRASTPTREGFYWGRWHTPAPGTADGGDCCARTAWEVHQVVDMGGLCTPDLCAFVPGVEKAQPLDAIEWGPCVRRPGTLGAAS